VSDRITSAFQQYSTTIFLIVLLVGWYELQIFAAVFFDFGAQQVRNWFKLSIMGGVNPGWMFAGISHRFPPYYGHLGWNVLFLALFGGAIERHITRRQYLMFFFGSGFAALFIYSLYWWLHGVSAHGMGASGAVFGLTVFYCYHTVRHHENTLTICSDGLTLRAELFTLTRTSIVVLAPILIVAELVGQLLGIRPSGDSAVIAHLAGVVFGLVFDYTVSTSGGRPSICDEGNQLRRSNAVMARNTRNQ
ncbi:MAG: rhomboid family intramembrane serine protease, partial [Halobacteriales archaeon]